MAQARGAPGLSRFGRLGAALAIPAVGAAALLVAVAVNHRATPAPPPVNVVVTPTPLPTPTEFSDLLSQFDIFNLLPRQAFGSLSVPMAQPPAGITVDLTLQSPPAGELPPQLPVWRFTPEAIDPRAVADRFGVSRNDTGVVDHGVVIYHAGLTVDSATTTITWIANGVASPQLGDRPRDSTSAERLATRWLLRSGLAPFIGATATVVQTSNGESASFPEWTITWPRQAPLPPPPTPAIDQVVARVSADGTLKELELTHPRVTSGSPYPLRPWQDAFRDAQAGRWYQPCCQPFPELVPSGTLHVTVRSVSLVYQTVRLGTGMYAIPMYAFGEGPGYQPGLVPAIAT